MIGEGTYVTVEEPCSGIIGSPPDHNLSRRWDGDRISPCWVLLIFDKWRVYGWIVGSDIERFGDHLKFVTVCQCLLYHPRRCEIVEAKAQDEECGKGMRGAG
jgi:hypothetical protein